MRLEFLKVAINEGGFGKRRKPTAENMCTLESKTMTSPGALDVSRGPAHDPQTVDQSLMPWQYLTCEEFNIFILPKDIIFHTLTRVEQSGCSQTHLS